MENRVSDHGDISHDQPVARISTKRSRQQYFALLLGWLSAIQLLPALLQSCWAISAITEQSGNLRPFESLQLANVPLDICCIIIAVWLYRGKSTNLTAAGMLVLLRNCPPIVFGTLKYLESSVIGNDPFGFAKLENDIFGICVLYHVVVFVLLLVSFVSAVRERQA